jgi:hypothetical protein
MIGWLEASWANVILTIALGLVACVLLLTAVEALPRRRQVPPHRDDWDIRELTGEQSEDNQP